MVKHLAPKLLVCLSLAFATSPLTGCAPRIELAPYSNLINQGLLPVSTTNPYLGANIFLAGEAQRSGYLMNFLKSRGGPVAIELEGNQLGEAALIMYYPKDREVYRAELQPIQRGETVMAEWLVRGPYAIERRDYRELNRLDGSLVGEPVFLVRGKPVKFGQQAGGITREVALNAGVSREGAGMQPNSDVIIPVVPTPKPKKRSIITKPKEETKLAEAPSAPLDPLQPLNSDQQALRLAQGLVERNDAGDGMHIVVSEKQTLAKLAEWYTGDAKNAEAIAKASGIEAGKEPSLASRVVIPQTLMKNDKRLID
jgi:hypothetical protein